MSKENKSPAKKTVLKMAIVQRAPQKPTHASRSAIRRAVKIVAEKFERAMEACLVVLRGRPGSENFEAPATYRVEVPNFWRIPEAIERVRKLIAEHPEGGPLSGFVPTIGKEEVGRTLKLRVAIARTFAASLELSRQQVLEAEQSAHFEEVTLHAT
jgi:chromatin segregation and condensation protein Rec8/ScpA/Scc1 (kleisin family)